MPTLDDLAHQSLLGPLLHELAEFGLEHVAHWQQGEFHHDHVLRLRTPPEWLPGPVLVVSTNCNAGVKEILCLADVPERYALWNARCPDNPEFSGDIEVLERTRTDHWFDPCEVLAPDARSELKPEFRRRQVGGGWRAVYHDPALD